MKKQHIAFSLFLSLCFSTMLLWINCSPSPSGATGAAEGPSTLQLAGIRERVIIRRDERGIPHVEANNEPDLYFAQGYTVASDRLWQMDLLRRTARGELSEILGNSALEQDKQHRAFGFASIAEQMASRLSPPSRSAFEAYARGVNAFIESLDSKSMPPEFSLLKYKPRAWSPADSLIIGKVYAESLTTSWETDLMRASYADLPQERRDALLPSVSSLDLIMVGSDKVTKKATALNQPTGLPLDKAKAIEALGQAREITDIMRRSLERVGLYAEDLAASNNWVVSGKRTTTGKPLLANDPHLDASAPSIWYMAHLNAPGLHVAGVTLAGTPGIIIGHNEQIAWGVTNVEADVQDLYVEKFDKENPSRYQTPTGWREAEVRHEQINVRKNPADPATETVEFDVIVTRHGPIILEKEGTRYALAWPALDPTTNESQIYYSINRARNWQEFSAALSSYTGFPLNFVYADVDGHIGYWAAGRYPIRKTGQGTVPYDGATDAGDWTGYIPFDATPHLSDPPSNVIITANNRVVGLDYTYYITQDWATPYRARRIYDLLSAKDKLSVDDFRSIQGDIYSFPDAIFAAEVVKLGRPLADSSPEWREMVTAFDGWDAMMNADSRTMLLSITMRNSLQRYILTAALGAERAQKYSWGNVGTAFDRIITTRPAEWLPKEFDSYEALILACYKDALDVLTKRIGTDKSQWTWGRILQVRFPHPLANTPLAGDRFNIAPIPQNGGRPAINRGAPVSMRYIADLSNWDNTRQGITLGQSGNPTSPHWKDQLADWQAVTPRPFLFNKDAVANAARQTLTLVAPGTN